VKLGDLLTADRIVLGIAGETVREAARALLHAVIASGHARDPERLEELITEALPSEVVTVGQQAFLLHFRTDAVDGVTAALGVTARPVHRLHDPGKEARIVLLLLAPPAEGSAYLRVLAAFARALGTDEVVTALERARSAEEVMAGPTLAGTDIPAELVVRDVLSRQVVAVAPETPLPEAARLMVQHGVAALPVLSEENEVLGLVSHGEILRHLLPRQSGRVSGEYRAVGRKPRLSTTVAREPLVRDVMDRSVLCLSEDQSLTEAATLMVNRKLERVPVVRDGALVGLLTRDDIVRRLFGP
jgi:CBS domain-containing protein